MAEGAGRKFEWRHMLRLRTVLYGTLLALIAAAAITGLALKNPLKVDVIRDRGALAREAAPGIIENSYRLHIMNTDERARSFRIEASGVPGLQVVGVEGPVAIDPAGSRLLPMRLRAPAEALPPGPHPIEILVRAEDGSTIERREKSTFIFPR